MYGSGNMNPMKMFEPCNLFIKYFIFIISNKRERLYYSFSYIKNMNK